MRLDVQEILGTLWKSAIKQADKECGRVEFEKLVAVVAEEQKQQKGCIDIKYMKRFYVFDDIEEQPRELTKIVKCVKYFSYWDFDNMENYSNATHWFFEKYSKEIFKLLIMPFDINCGYSIY